MFLRKKNVWRREGWTKRERYGRRMGEGRKKKRNDEEKKKKEEGRNDKKEEVE